MLRAIIFDFDGVIVDSENLIFQLTQQMAAQEDWTVTEDEYFRDYLALDDRGIIEHLYQSHGRPVDVQRRDELVRWKFEYYQKIIRDGLPAMPGAVDFVKAAAARYPIAIASGSLRVEIEHLLGKLGLRECFTLIASADDCERSKPDPEVYLRALDRLRARREWEPPLEATEGLAIEDAPLGVVAAQRAGMRCLALAHSRPTDELRHADWVFREFSEVDLQQIHEAFL